MHACLCVHRSLRYVVTIGVVQPSYVIRQFLTAQQIQNLTFYLEELHKSGATADHTTLLLNCYTKLKVGLFVSLWRLSNERTNAARTTIDLLNGPVHV